MTDTKFRDIYKEKYTAFLNERIKVITDNSNKECEYLRKLYRDHSEEMSYKRSILVSEIMDEYGIVDVKVNSGMLSENLSSHFTKLSYSVIEKSGEEYDKTISKLALKLKCPLDK